MEKIKMYKKRVGCGACDMSLKMLSEYDLDIIDIEDIDVSELNIKSVPTFIQEEKRHEGFANEELLKMKGFSLTKSGNIGIEIGNTCPICKIGIVEDIGGCNSCTNCYAQLKCGL